MWYRNAAGMGDGGKETKKGLDLGELRVEWTLRLEIGMGKVLGFVSLPMTVKNPPSESSSGSMAFSFVKTPTSTFEEAPNFMNVSFQVPNNGGSCRNMVTTSACDIES